MKKTVYLIIIIILSVFIVILAGKTITNLSDNNVNTVSVCSFRDLIPLRMTEMI